MSSWLMWDLRPFVLGSALMYYATKKVVSPIRSLAALSARMSELDFEARYTGIRRMRLEFWATA